MILRRWEKRTDRLRGIVGEAELMLIGERLQLK